MTPPTAGPHAIAIGHQAVASGANSIAIGSSAVASNPNSAVFNVASLSINIDPCETCGAFLGSAECAEKHAQWHAQLDFFIAMLDPTKAEIWASMRDELRALFSETRVE